MAKSDCSSGRVGRASLRYRRRSLGGSSAFEENARVAATAGVCLSCEKLFDAVDILVLN